TRQMSIPQIDVHLVEKQSVHVMAIRMFVVRPQPNIFIQVKGTAAREIEPLGAMQLHQSAINRFHGAASRETKNSTRISPYFARDELRNEFDRSVRVGLNDDFHLSFNVCQRCIFYQIIIESQWK